MGPKHGEPSIERVLLTNDDGIDAPGLEASIDAFEEYYDVTVSAPMEDQSGIGRQRSHSAAVESRAAGYAVDGTPADCVAFALRGLDETFDLVVSGVNHGPNVGAHTIDGSGTVGAAVEALALGTPAIAVSAFDPEAVLTPIRDVDALAHPATVAREVVEYLDGRSSLAKMGVLALNVSIDVGAEMRITNPAADYDTHIARDGDTVEFRDTAFATVDGPLREVEDYSTYVSQYPPESERRALLEGVSGLALRPHPVHGSTDLDFEPFISRYNRSRQESAPER